MERETVKYELRQPGGWVNESKHQDNVFKLKKNSVVHKNNGSKIVMNINTNL